MLAVIFPRIDYQVTLGCLWPNCQDGFKNTKELINHVRAAHSPELKCPYCNKNAKYGAGLIHHVRVHTGKIYIFFYLFFFFSWAGIIVVMVIIDMYKM